MDTAEERILAALRKCAGETDGVRSFAKLLGVSPALWVLTRDGQRRLGAAIADGARRLPDLSIDQDITTFLLYELPRRNRKRRGSKLVA